jgi:uncharacterized cupin superfamily protein
MSYAKKNLRDVEDSALKYGLSNTQEARFPREDLGAEQTGVNYLVIKPGQREAFAHRHREAEEVYVDAGFRRHDDADRQPRDGIRARGFDQGSDDG